MQPIIQHGLQLLRNLPVFENPRGKYLITGGRLLFRIYDAFFPCLDQSVIKVLEKKLQLRSRFSCDDYTSAVDSFSFPQFPLPHTALHCKQCFAKTLMAKTVCSDTAGDVERRMLRLLRSSDKLL